MIKAIKFNRKVTVYLLKHCELLLACILRHSLLLGAILVGCTKLISAFQKNKLSCFAISLFILQLPAISIVFFGGY